MKILRVLLLSLLPSLAFAQVDVPEDGIWGDSTKPGSGFVIEAQDGKMAVAAFTYTPAGPSTWFLATGNYDSIAKRFIGTLSDLTGGQCLTCAYRAPGGGGNTVGLEIRFDSLVSGRVFINGTQAFSIKRSYFNFPTPDDLVLGGWAASYYSIGGGLSGHALRMETKRNAAPGEPTVQGRIDTETRLALGGFNASIGKYLILVDSSTSFWVAYVFDGTKDFWFGDAYLYRKTESITDTTARSHYAARILTNASLSRLSGAGAKDAEDAREEAHWHEYRAMKSSPAGEGKRADDLLAREVQELEAIILAK